MRRDLNKASEDELMEIPNFNIGRIRYLLATRKKLGGFKDCNDVKQAPGFSDGMIRRLRDAGFSIGSLQGRVVDVNPRCC